MKTLAVITGERHLFKPFELYDISDELRILVCRCGIGGYLVRKLRKMQIAGYIADEDIHLPFTRYDGSGIFCIKLPMLINKCVKIKNIPTESVAVVSSDEKLSESLFENIAHMFREFYIVSPDYDFAAKQAERLFFEFGISAHTDEPEKICDVEIFMGADCCGLGRWNFNYLTKYEVRHGYNLPVGIDSRAFTEALFAIGIITESELKKLSISIGGVAFD